MIGDKPLPCMPPLWPLLAELAWWLQKIHGLTESEIRDVVMDVRGVSLWFRLLDGGADEDENLESWNDLEVDWRPGRARWKQCPDSIYFPLVVSWVAVTGSVKRMRRERLALQAPAPAKKVLRQVSVNGRPQSANRMDAAVAAMAGGVRDEKITLSALMKLKQKELPARYPIAKRTTLVIARQRAKEQLVAEGFSETDTAPTNDK